MKGKRGKPPEDKKKKTLDEQVAAIPKIKIGEAIQKKLKPIPPASPPMVPPPAESIAPQGKLSFTGIHADILADTTSELCVLGARDSGKTTVCVYKEIRKLVEIPKLKSFLFRFSDKDTQSKLIPFFREMCLDEFDEKPEWDNKEFAFNFGNGSIAYMFGLQATSAQQRYSKMRGLGVARVFAEQAEELPNDIGLELRAALRQLGFNRYYQLTYCANPPDEKHFLVKQFPIDQRYKNRKAYYLSLYDNAHHLAPDTIRQLEQAFPPEHPKHKTIILGLPGVNVTGEPIYGKLYQPALHTRPIAYDPKRPLLECFDFGKQSPTWVVGQRPAGGGMHWLGGIMGMEMFLEDFLPIVQEHRTLWFPDLNPLADPAADVPNRVKTCCTLSVSKKDGARITGVEQLKDAGFRPKWVEGGNSPDIVLAMIERQAAYLRRRGTGGVEMLGVNNDESRWLKATDEGVEPSQFMAQGYGGGYAWSDKLISVGRNEVKQPHSDDWFEFSQRCAEAIELNFSVKKKTDDEAAREKAATEKARQRGYVPISSWS